MSKESEKKNKSVEGSSQKPTLQDWILLGAYLGLKGTWKTGKFGYKTSRFLAENSWNYIVKPFSKEVAWPLTKFTARHTARGSQRFYRWADREWHKPIAPDFNWRGTEFSYKGKQGPIVAAAVGLVTLAVTSLYPHAVNAAQTAGETYHNGAQALERLNKELANKGDETKSTITIVPREEVTPSSTPTKTPESTATKLPEPTKTPTPKPTNTPAPQPTVKVEQKMDTSAKTVNVENYKEDPRFLYYKPFIGKEANEIAEKMGVNAGSFFYVPEQLVNKMSAFLDPELLPIWPPSILAQKDLIYKLCFDKDGKMVLAPNMVALIMTIESGGDPVAGSNVGAQGLMQVMPFHFKGADIFNTKDPETNIRYGIKVYKGFLSEATANNKKHYPDVHAMMYIRGMMGYNGGGTQTYLPYDQLWNETKFYADHTVRLFLTLEVASELRKKGFSDSEIVRQIRSDEVTARASVLSRMRFSTHDEYRRIYNALSTPHFKHPGVTTEETMLMRKYYEEAKQSIPPQSFSPGLAVFWGTGGRSFLNLADNKDLNKWNNPNSKRN